MHQNSALSLLSGPGVRPARDRASVRASLWFAAILLLFPGWSSAQPSPAPSSDAVRLQLVLAELAAVAADPIDADRARHRSERLRYWLDEIRRARPREPVDRWARVMGEARGIVAARLPGEARAMPEEAVAALAVSYCAALIATGRDLDGFDENALSRIYGALRPALTTFRGPTRPGNYPFRVMAMTACTVFGQAGLGAARSLESVAVLESSTGVPAFDPRLASAIDRDFEALRKFSAATAGSQTSPPAQEPTDRGGGKRKLTLALLAVLAAAGAWAFRRRPGTAVAAPGPPSKALAPVPVPAPAAPALVEPGSIEPEKTFSLDDLATYLPTRYAGAARLAQGGMGVVFQARDSLLGRDVAVKMLSPVLKDDPASQKRFLREARALAALSHPNILTIFDVQPEPWPFFSMELLGGETLRNLVDRGPVDDARFFDIALPLIDALEFAHGKGIVHRDIKPENVHLSTDGTPRLMDFGLATTGQQTAITRTGQVVGTLLYMAPEQMEEQPVDGRADIYSLSLVLHEMLAGRLPFSQNGVIQKLSGVQVLAEALGGPRGPVLAPILKRALMVDPKARYRDAGELREALQEARRTIEGRAHDCRRLVRMLEDLRTQVVHRLTGKLSIAHMLRDEPERFKEAFLDPAALGEILACLEGEGGFLPRVRELLELVGTVEERPELAPIHSIAGTLSDEEKTVSLLSTLFWRLLDEGSSGGAPPDFARLQEKVALLAGRYKELNHRIKAVVATWEIDPARTLEERARCILGPRSVRFDATVQCSTTLLVQDPGRLGQDLEQVFDCLLENAFQARATTVLAVWSCSADHLELLLENDGSGLPEGDPEALFTPGATTKETGTGTGLAASRSLLTRHGGRIRLERRSGGGARVVVRIGADAGPHAVAQRAAGREGAP